MYIEVRIISTKTAPEKLAMISCTFVCDTSGSSYDNNATEAMKAHTKTFCSLRR